MTAKYVIDLEAETTCQGICCFNFRFQLKKPQIGGSVIALGQGEKDCIFRQEKIVFTVFALIFALSFMQNQVTTTESKDMQNMKRRLKKSQEMLWQKVVRPIVHGFK